MGHVIKSSASTTQFRKMGIIFQVAFQGSSLLFSPYLLLLLLFTLDIKISGKGRSKKCAYPLKQDKTQGEDLKNRFSSNTNLSIPFNYFLF